MSPPSHPPWFNRHNNIRWRIQAVKFIIMQFSSRSSSSPLGLSIILNTFFWKTLSLCSSLKMKGRVSHLCSTTGKITVLCSLI
jgi:hypothetical protein